MCAAFNQFTGLSGETGITSEDRTKAEANFGEAEATWKAAVQALEAEKASAKKLIQKYDRWLLEHKVPILPFTLSWLSNSASQFIFLCPIFSIASKGISTSMILREHLCVSRQRELARLSIRVTA